MRAAFRVKPYKHPKLKYLVRGKENGKLVRRFFETKREAETFAQQKNMEALNQGIESINFPSELRVMAQKADDLLSPYGKSILDAANFMLPHLQAMKRTCMVRALTDELLSVKKRDGASERYVGDLRSRLGQFSAAFEGKSVSAFTATEVDEWLRSLEVSSTTRNNFRRVLIVAFNFAVDRGYCLTNPAKKSAKAKEVEGIVEILSVEQTVRLLEVCPKELLPYVAIGAFAGLRSAELERLDWSEIDLQAGLIEVKAKKAKSARRRFVRIRENLAAWLRPVARRRGDVTPRRYRQALDSARKAAEIADWPQNALRHGFASYHLAHFNDAAALALELGHTNSNLVFQHYRQIVKPKDAERYWSVLPTDAENIVSMSVVG